MFEIAMLCFAGDIPLFVPSSCDCEETDDGVKLRSAGDTAFVSGKKDGVKKALKLYTQAIEMEPNNQKITTNGIGHGYV